MKNRKKYLVVSCKMSKKAKEKLASLGYSLIESVCLKNVQPGIGHHPDMQLVNAGDKWICAPETFDYYTHYFRKANIPLIKGETTPGYEYPSDVAYNIASTGKFAIHNFKYTDPVFLENSCCKQINVSQGYSKCSICVVCEDAFITSDEGIYKELLKHGIDVLKVSCDNISLPGYDHGFIGGASGLIEKNLLAFCGDVSSHPQYREIDSFCRKYNVNILSLTDEELSDFGTIISLG